MKTIFSLVLSYVMAANVAISQSFRYSPANPGIGLTAYSLKQSDPLAFIANQSSLALVKHAGIGIFSERRFMLRETTVYLLGASFPTHLGNMGIQVNYAGYKLFQESKIGVAYARSLSQYIDIGVQFNYYRYRIPAYGKAATLFFEIGSMFHLTNRLQAGLHVYNPVGVKLGKSKTEKLASTYKFGLGYDASDQFFISAEVVKETEKPVSVVAGFQYQFEQQFFVKAGFFSNNTSVYAGAGIDLKLCQLHISTSYHPQLGFSPGLLLLAYPTSKIK